MTLSMQIQKISLKDFGASLQQSIGIGKAQYLVLFIGALIAFSIESLLRLTSFGQVASAILGILWIAGHSLVSQTLVEEKGLPKVSQFFAAFYKTSLLKKLVPALVVTGVFSLIFLVIYSVAIGGVAMTFFKEGGMADPLRIANFFGIITMGLTAVSLIFSAPFLFFSQILIFQNLGWTDSLRLSIKATLRNFWVMAVVFQVPAILVLCAGSFGLIFRADPLIDGLSAMTLFLELASYGLKIILLFLTPWVMTLSYLIYKRTFVFDQPDNRLELAK